jgi:hypothetical protein
MLVTMLLSHDTDGTAKVTLPQHNVGDESC